MKKLLKWCKRIVIGLVTLVALLFVFWLAVPMWGYPMRSHRQGVPPLPPPWALECWLWEDDTNTAAFVDELMAGYETHDIPFRTIMIDSPWSTRYNDFNVDEARYPNPARWFKDIEDRGYRVVLWMTPMVNRTSKDTAIQDSDSWYSEAKDMNYLALDGASVSWWKGNGGFIDYTSPEGVEWWRSLQQPVFDWGIDGWKLDGSATYFGSSFGKLWIPYGPTQGGWMTMRGYMNHYYRDEYQHGLTQNPEFVTLARAMDDQIPYIHPDGFAPLDAAPITWVGDQDHKWTEEDEGLGEALRDILESARQGYCVIGSDVAGYGGSEIPPNLYIRWSQFSAFCGLFLNGGHGERRLWMRSNEELRIVREYAWLHTELVPYIYAHAAIQHEGGPVLMRPVGKGVDYYFGDAFFIAPIHQDSETRQVELPQGRWRYWFDDTKVVEGPVTVTREFMLDHYPIYVRDGAIIPMHIARDYTHIGQRDWDAYLTLNLYPHGESRLTVTHTDGSGTMDVTVTEEDGAVTVNLAGVVKAHILRVLVASKPASVSAGGTSLPEGAGWTWDADIQRVVVRSDARAETAYTIR